MKAYKGFNPDMTCRGFQYKEGETYKEDNASLCNSGFHACENPLEVFTYYPPCDENGNLNKFHEVEMEDVSLERDSGSTKICSKQIKIGAELNFFGLAKAHVEWVKTQLDDSKKAVNSGDRSSAVNSGNCSSAVNSGNCSSAVNSGYSSSAVNSGNCSSAVNSGDSSSAVNSGYRSSAVNSGDRSSAVNSGNCSSAVNSGDRSSAVNSGYRSSAVNSGDSSSAVNSGDRSSAVNSGNCSSAVNSGKDSIAVAWGIDSKAKATLGSYIVLAEWIYNEDDCAYVLKGAKMRKVDGVNIKENTYYQLKKGRFVEVKE